MEALANMTKEERLEYSRYIHQTDNKPAIYNYWLYVLRDCIAHDDLYGCDGIYTTVLTYRGVLPKKFKKYEQSKHREEWTAKLKKAYNDNIHLMVEDEGDDVVLK